MVLRSLSALLVAAAIGCDEPVPPPPALVGEDDAFSQGGLAPLHADADHLYFYYSATGISGRVPGPDPGIYRVSTADGEPTLVLGRTGVAGVQRSSDALVMVTRQLEAAELVMLPLDGTEPTTIPLTDGESLGVASSSGYTFVLAADSEANGRMSITRLASGADAEQVFAVRERAFVDGWDFHALNGQLYWLEEDRQVTRIADDQSQTGPEAVSLPSFADIPTTGQVEDERLRLLGPIGDEMYASVYFESFHPNGDTLDNGDPSGDYGYGGGAIYTVGTDARLVAVDVVQAVIAGDWIYGQDRDGDMVRINPVTGEITKLAGSAPTFGMFTRPVVNDDHLFYADSTYGGPYAIRSVSLDAR